MSTGSPLIILAPHRSYTSVVCAMLGQHPQMYGLPEMNFFLAETLQEWWMMFRRGTAIGVHGPLRVIAEIFYQEQNEETIRQAWIWLRQRLDRDTASVFKEITSQVYPLSIVDKSPTTVYRIEYMERARRIFPQAKYLHLLRHPLGHGKSVIKALEEFDQFGALPRGLNNPQRETSRFPQSGRGFRTNQVPNEQDNSLYDYSTESPTADPQTRWHRLHSNICDFLSTIPGEQWLRIKGEDLISNPDPYLREIAGWLGLRTDDAAIEEMKHPEKSPYACFGPSNAHLGNDPNFLKEPNLRAGKVSAQSLELPLPWRKDGKGFKPEVRELARKFGYD